jgi:hypothetical protein
LTFDDAATRLRHRQSLDEEAAMITRIDALLPQADAGTNDPVPLD